MFGRAKLQWVYAVTTDQKLQNWAFPKKSLEFRTLKCTVILSSPRSRERWKRKDILANDSSSMVCNDIAEPTVMHQRAWRWENTNTRLWDLPGLLEWTIAEYSLADKQGLADWRTLYRIGENLQMRCWWGGRESVDGKGRALTEKLRPWPENAARYLDTVNNSNEVRRDSYQAENTKKL